MPNIYLKMTIWHNTKFQMTHITVFHFKIKKSNDPKPFQVKSSKEIDTMIKGFLFIAWHMLKSG